MKAIAPPFESELSVSIGTFLNNYDVTSRKVVNKLHNTNTKQKETRIILWRLLPHGVLLKCSAYYTTPLNPEAGRSPQESYDQLLVKNTSPQRYRET